MNASRSLKKLVVLVHPPHPRLPRHRSSDTVFRGGARSYPSRRHPLGGVELIYGKYLSKVPNLDFEGVRVVLDSDPALPGTVDYEAFLMAEGELLRNVHKCWNHSAVCIQLKSAIEGIEREFDKAARTTEVRRCIQFISIA